MKRLGVIGCGTWGANHARTLAGMGALAAVTDRSAEKAVALANSLGCAAVDIETMLADPAIDGVVLALTPGAHAPAAMLAMAAGKPFLVEKPMALTAAEAARIAADALAAGLVAMTGHVLLFHPAFEAMVGLARSGALGDIRHIQSQRMGFGRFLDETDVAMDLLPHDLSMIEALLGSLPASAEMTGRPLLSGGVDLCELHLTYPGGISAHCSISRLSPVRDRKMMVIGTRAIAVFDDLLDWPQKLAVTPLLEADGAPAMATTHYVEVARTQPLEAELRHFIDCIETGQTPRANLTTGAAIIDLLTRLQLSEQVQSRSTSPHPHSQTGTMT